MRTQGSGRASTCRRILARNRALYGLAQPSRAPREPRPMPFAASRRHEYWTVDLRYLDMHQLGGGHIYVISVLDNYSRAVLASGLSRTQDVSAYLIVLHAAIRQFGAPEAVVSDGGGIFRATQVLPRLQHVVDAARVAGVTIVRVQIVVPEEHDSPVFRGQFRQRVAVDWLRPGAANTAFHPGFEPQPGDMHVIKPRYSAFFGTDLEAILRQRGIRTVIVGGLTTDICVGTTARDAFQRDFWVVTLADCTAEIGPGRHEAALYTLGRNVGEVCTSAEVVAAWEQRPIFVANGG